MNKKIILLISIILITGLGIGIVAANNYYETNHNTHHIKKTTINTNQNNVEKTNQDNSNLNYNNYCQICGKRMSNGHSHNNKEKYHNNQEYKSYNNNHHTKKQHH